MPPDVRIATARLLLRPPMEEDVEAIAREINDMAVVRMLARVPFPYSRADAMDFLASSRAAAARGTDLNLVITRDGAAIGCIGLADHPAVNELGYWLGRAHWGQGLATEAATAFVGWCFANLRIDTIRAGVFIDNPASLRVQEKLGFVATGASLRPSLARGEAVPHTDTLLPRDRFNGPAR